jgi:hypothetical protein
VAAAVYDNQRLRRKRKGARWSDERHQWAENINHEAELT